MKQTLRLIALRTIRHNDRHNIFTAYSLECGRVAFAVPAGAGKSASRMRALLMPLSVLECEADMRPGREVHTLSNPRALLSLHGLHSDPVKGVVALFVAEVLGSVLRDGPPDSGVWHYVAHGIGSLDSLPGRRVANFHLCFLAGLARVLGIAPDASDYRVGMTFDMADGRFRQSPPLHSRYLSAADSRGVWALTRLTFDNMHAWHMSRETRNRVLDGMLEYFSMHYAPLSGVKSLEVVRSLM